MAQACKILADMFLWQHLKPGANHSTLFTLSALPWLAKALISSSIVFLVYQICPIFRKDIYTNGTFLLEGTIYLSNLQLVCGRIATFQRLEHKNRLNEVGAKMVANFVIVTD
ncbi:hypothetical protein KDW_06580 [Dictyobacter vulcani]|uniref:Uncharacterized protein n=1 Tax=Dictyobacter vulcani TaxID=2607529 RepID=A0A5J4KMU6_9CHLR|nr:hypothetical protein KDW_06580 [Dictyobacter vulcani]